MLLQWAQAAQMMLGAKLLRRTAPQMTLYRAKLLRVMAPQMVL
jgi:hypothetical protein